VVTVPENVTITVTVDDGHGHAPTRNLQVTVNPVIVTEVHISFGPAAENGTGTLADAYDLLGDTDYTFTATNQDGVDITSEVTFHYANDAGGSFPQGAFTANVFHTNAIGSATFAVTGVYHEGDTDEVSSLPDLAGEEMHHTIILVLP
jgi:hypothetical protein